jgi:hypothetical protein
MTTKHAMWFAGGIVAGAIGSWAWRNRATIRAKLGI